MSVETISAVVAAVAAVGAVYFARDTVKESVAGRKDAAKHHAAQIAEIKAATAASAEQHRIEMADRVRAFEAERALELITQLQRVHDHLFEYVDAAQSELLDPPEVVQGEDGTTFSATRLPAQYIRLRSELVILSQLDGPDMRDAVPAPDPADLASSTKVWKEALDLLIQIGEVLDRAKPQINLNVAKDADTEPSTPS